MFQQILFFSTRKYTTKKMDIPNYSINLMHFSANCLQKTIKTSSNY